MNQIFNQKYYDLIYRHGTVYLAALLFGILDRINAVGSLRSGYISTSEMHILLSLSPRTFPQFDWIFRYLANIQYLDKKDNKNGVQYKLKDDLALPNAGKLREELLKMDSNIVFSCDYMEFVAKYYPDFLRGEVLGHEILFIKDGMRNWLNYFSNYNPGYVVFNTLGAECLIEHINKNSRPIKILEIGGGTGNASIKLFEKVEDVGLIASFAEYYFSDISPFLLKIGKKNIENAVLSKHIFKFCKLDFDSAFSIQGFNRDDFDVVYAVNSLHVARNIGFSLSEIFKILRPGGVLILSESIRSSSSDTLIQEFIFNLLDNYLTFDRSDQLRLTPGFLTRDNWEQYLKATSFKNYNFNKDSGNILDRHFPENVMVIKAEKDLCL